MVDDDARIRRQIAGYLADRGYMVVEAANADEALLLLEDVDRSIDCVFSDVQMPGRYDGVDLARWVLGHRPGLAVLLASGSFQVEDLEPELRTVLPVLAKPYRGEAVEASMASLVTAMRLNPVDPLADSA
ncbi:response regulator [Sphingomonas sp. UNC305MFCol5.2]|uniref:response regulator n=1 Tax=Sphingomonas sp. UNC305MFCol5.2 TaxID=1449076 RepID=UPI0018CC335C|nr:response regulator [Sphingomonas sp. UNC305MFCol5.2]